MKIISASRRTDIPALYTPWFMNRIRAGFCHWLNPFGGQVYRVSLRPEDCVAIVFWTRNARPLLPHLKELSERGYHFYFQYTINCYPREIDARSPSLEAALRTVRRLAELVGPECVLWRYDPVLISDLTPVSYHLTRFEQLSQALAGATRRCYVSFLDVYRKTERNLSGLAAYQLRRPYATEQRELLEAFVELAGVQGISIHLCCDEIPAGIKGGPVHRAHCVDPDLIRRLRPELDLPLQPGPTRPGCGCAHSVDIGSYDTCILGCLYCYATSSPKAALAHRRAHDPKDTMLWRPPRLQGVDLDAVARPAPDAVARPAPDAVTRPAPAARGHS